MQKTNHTYQNDTIHNRSSQNEIIQSKSTKNENTQKGQPSKELKNFKLIQDTELLNQTKLAAQNEKAAMLILLEYLCEIDRRKLFASLNYNSLFEYIHKALGYSESQASDRVNTVRLMNQNRGVKEQLATGGLNLTTAAQLQRFIQKEKKVNPEILEMREGLIAQCQGQSKKSVEQIILKHASESTIHSMKERTRTIDSENLEIKFIADLELQLLMRRAKELVHVESHSELMKLALKTLIQKKEIDMGKNKELELAKNKEIYIRKNTETEIAKKNNEYINNTEKAKKLLDKISDFNQRENYKLETLVINENYKLEAVMMSESPIIQKNQTDLSDSDQLKSKKENQQRYDQRSTRMDTKRNHSDILSHQGSLCDSKELNLNDLNESINSNSNNTSVAKMKFNTKNPRYIPFKIKHQVFQRANYSCQWTECESQNHLEIDHIQPIAKGGRSELDNLRILCRAHNQRAAVPMGLI